jgi:cleavage and polyadenylation specificity factor subunit 3
VRSFTEIIASTVMQGGRVLIPAFALGRAQELLLIMEEYWAAHPEIQHVPIYYASPLAQKSLLVYQTYINAMNDRIRGQFEVDNPFNFKHISNLRSIREFEDVGPAVVMASPGMLQSGMSRQLFDMWCQVGAPFFLVFNGSRGATWALKASR